MIKQITPFLYSIPVTLPNSPLKSLNCYVFVGPERKLLVDTGFNRPECLESLQSGIRELGLDMHKTDIFVTHCHADHCGLVPAIATEDSTIYMSAIDKNLMNQFVAQDDSYWDKLDNFFIGEGAPPSEMAESRRLNPARRFLPSRNFDCLTVNDNDVVKIADLEITCIHTPGHTPGHMCLYLEQEKIMLTGDHVLFDITPNITVWSSMQNSLENYMQSLQKIKQYDVILPLAAHRASHGTLGERVDDLLYHHEQRLRDAWDIIRNNNEATAYQVAAQMKWSIRARDWDDFPLSQKRFAVGEAISHINYLVDHGRATRINRNGVNYYSVRE